MPRGGNLRRLFGISGKWPSGAQIRYVNGLNWKCSVWVRLQKLQERCVVEIGFRCKKQFG